MKSTCKEVAVVAIDFGTTFSGYAYSFQSEYNKDPKNMYCNTKWTPGIDRISQKAPTAILLRWDNKRDEFVFEKFGYEAQDKYAEMVDEDTHKNYVLVDRFKMRLYSEAAASRLRRDTEILLGNGESIKAIVLICMFIAYLKDHFLDFVQKRITIKITASDFRWVLTVPAIWTDGAKQLMREAAEMAGIPPSNLSVAFEPEAAALACMHLFASGPEGKGPRAIMKKRPRCLVIDAGGGTVDFTVCEVSGSGALVLKHEASGGPWGGTRVDQKLLDLLVEVVGPEVFDQFAKTKREDFVELQREFEHRKRHLREDRDYLTMRFPLSLRQIYRMVKHESLTTAVSNKYGDEIKIENDKLRIRMGLLRKLFDSICESIVAHTKRLLGKQECQGVNTILLVGGFGASDVVQQAIQKGFPNHHVVIPEDPELAVVKGAVLYGHNPLMVETRIARYTYGTKCREAFVDGKHPENKKIFSDGIAMCKDIFCAHVIKGQELTAGKPQKRQIYKASEADQTIMPFKIYASTDENPTFVTDDSCTHIGELKIAIPDTTGGRDRTVYCQMSFGDTEMVVTATEEKTGKSVSATLNFLGKPG